MRWIRYNVLDVREGVVLCNCLTVSSQFATTVVSSMIFLKLLRNTRRNPLELLLLYLLGGSWNSTMEYQQKHQLFSRNNMLGCGSFVRGRKRKKVDSRPFLYRRVKNIRAEPFEASH